MLVRYGMAAILAAFATLMGNVVWAQESCPQGGFSTGYAPPACCAEKPCSAPNKDCCATGACCKDGKCCKDGACCCKSKKCDANCTCCKDNKCECGKGGDCCCKDGKCCCKDKANVKKTKHGSCPFLNKLAKSTTIIMVMPSSLPLLGVCHPEMMGMLPHPPLPMGPQVMMPIPLPPPPMLTPPGLPVPNMVSPVMPSQNVAFPNPNFAPPSCHPCPAQSVVLPAPREANPPMKESAALETCLSLLSMASELCSIARPLSVPSLCASAVGLLMEASPVVYGYEQLPTPHGRYEPQCTPPAPSLPQVCVPYCSTVGTAMPQCSPSAYPCGHGGYGGHGYGGYSGGSAMPQCCPNAYPCPTTVESLPVMPCAIATPATVAKVRIIATAYSDQLEMNVGDATCIRCKKMTVTIGDNEITLSRFDNRVRVRGEELKATADSVRSDRKDHLILEGDVVLHYKKDGHSANVTGDCIELNLSSGAVTIKPIAKTTVRPAIRIDRVDTDE